MSGTRMNSGFALIDALAALLLFAVVLLAAIAALVRGMHVMHETALTARAVDLAADLLEEHRALPAAAPAAPLLASWNQRVQNELPAAAGATAVRLVAPLVAAEGMAAP